MFANIGTYMDLRSKGRRSLDFTSDPRYRTLGRECFHPIKARTWPCTLWSVLSFLVLEIISTFRPQGSVTRESRMVGLVPVNLKVINWDLGAADRWPDMVELEQEKTRTNI